MFHASADMLPSFVTVPLLVPTCPPPGFPRLLVNALTSVVGYVAVELRGAHSPDPLPSFAFDLSTRIKGNYIARAASWRQEEGGHFTQSLAGLAGKSVRVAARIPGAKVFSLTLECTADKEVKSS